ncbi:hypothetical protein DUNSADRAFT_11346 [Dunaliella salina]|uniref:Uncharacterized protein n=1 Tax=Dunaliella salina TaxID=3046 RepID=A0ABQ7GDL4_DUNSA|nr:hypothetical protein DUNSADRAFT_11346 [Dunaliella salina]|eukprot:KAF5832702.1 hypothetical protein DUNSADRAFT_11346 [Dunaliella salina]
MSTPDQEVIKPPKPSREEEAAESNSDSGDEEGSVTEGGSTSDSSSSSKKKKKKKKSKKKKEGGESEQHQQQPALSKQERAALEKKFQEALSTIKDSDDLWLNLSGSLIQDGKLEKLLERLKDNKMITSIDLSGNQISDAGAQAIGSVLEAQGAVPELISLDLRDNSFSPAGLERLALLGKHRSQLDIKTGSLSDPVLPPAEGKELKEVTKGPMFRKFFQGPGEEEDATTSDAQVDLPDISPAELWSRISQLLKGGQSSIPELALSLQELAAILQHEFSVHTSNKEVEKLLKSDSHAKACLSHLPDLQSAMDLSPPDVIVQFSPNPQPAVGSHRVWASAVVALLLGRGYRSIDQSVSKTQLATQVLHLALQRPMCNALHTKALHVLHACVNSTEDALLAPLLQERPQDGTAPALPNLIEVLVDLGGAAAEVSCGQRSSLLGFVIMASRILQGMCNEPAGSAIKNQAVKRALAASPRWTSYVKPKSGPFHKMCAEQDAELGGPRPSAPAMAADYGDLGGGLMSSQDILALIESMNMG